MANLIYLPRTQNRSKGAEINQRAIDLGQRLVASGVSTKEDSAAEAGDWEVAQRRRSTSVLLPAKTS